MTCRTTRLAQDGGTPVRKEPILPGWPGGLLIGAEEKAQVLEVLESQSLYRHYGPHPRHKAAELEQRFAAAMGARYALAVTSGTGALLVGLAALGVGPGDEVIVPTYTWVATINAVVTLGAVPVFVDIVPPHRRDPPAGRPHQHPSVAGRVGRRRHRDRGRQGRRRAAVSTTEIGWACSA